MKKAVIGTCVVLLALIVIVGSYAFDLMAATEYESCLTALNARLKLSPQGTFTGEWKEFDPGLFNDFRLDMNTGECRGFIEAESGVLKDKWNSKLRFEARMTERGLAPRIVSAGRDRTFGTDDDLCSHHCL
jgi:hypothetical protein